jgi:nucleoside-diphosphate-sugar epimerase
MTIFFTGHLGFLGREIIPFLKPIEEIVTFEGDCNDLVALKKFVTHNHVDKIIHSAARGGRRNKIDTQATLINNVTITSNILKFDLPTILFCSGAIYNRENSIDSAKENSSTSSFPSDYYGQSKFISNLIARDNQNCISLRFFNVFGKSEGLDRFITYNINQYLAHKPMVIFSDFLMDFFFVKDVLPIIYLWLKQDFIPKEMNLVYNEKYFLSEICGLINRLSDYKVPITIQENSQSNSYTGDGTLLESLKLPLLGLQNGMQEVFNFLGTKNLLPNLK